MRDDVGADGLDGLAVGVDPADPVSLHSVPSNAWLSAVSTHVYLADGAGEGGVLAHLHRDVLHVVHEPRLHPRAHCGQNSFFYISKMFIKKRLTRQL